LGSKPIAALLLAWCSLLLLPAYVAAQDAPVQGTPVQGTPSSAIGEPATAGFVSPLDEPAAPTAAPTPAPTDTPADTPTPSVTPSPTSTVAPTATATPANTPTNTSTPTIAPLQVSPLIAQGGTRLPDDGSLFWIGTAALLVLLGSTVLLVAERRSDQ
jgi:hypothetical protein